MSSQRERSTARMSHILQGGGVPTPPRASLALGAAPAQGLMREELEKARQKISELEAAGTGVQLLDPARIRHSRLRDRHELGLSDNKFRALREDIGRAGPDGQPVGVTVPIKVRPVDGDPDHDFEVVYGHRRHQASLELALPVPAIVEPLDDQQTLLEMRRENQERENLSPYEEALSLDRMLAEGVFADQTALAEALGLTKGACSKLLALARLPADVIAIFRDPREVSVHLGQTLRAAIKDRPKVVTALKTEAKERRLSAAQVMARLKEQRQPEALEGRTRSGVQIKAFPNGGGMQLIIERQLNQEQLNRLAEALEAL